MFAYASAQILVHLIKIGVKVPIQSQYFLYCFILCVHYQIRILYQMMVHQDHIVNI